MRRMTKYVINSGGVRNEPARARRFFAEVVKDLGTNPKMLVALFAQPREYWEEKFAKYQTETNNFIPEGVELSYELAFPDIFTQQVGECDIVYVSGGDDHLVQYWFKQLNIPKVWEGKVVATNSASSDMLSNHFWTCDWRQCMDGLGVLPFKFLPHYKSNFGANDPRGPIDWGRAKQELIEFGDKSLELHALEEGDYIVIEQ